MKIQLTARLLLLLVISLSYNIVAAQWVQTNGPSGITVKKLFDNDSVLFDGTSANGIFKSYDNGATWITSNAGIENQEVFSIERDSQYVYTGTENGVYRSADNGATWLAANNGIQNLFVSNLLYAAYKEHIGFYPTPTPIKIFKDLLVKYNTSKGAIQFPINKPLPKTLIRNIVKFRVAEDIEKSMAKMRPA